MNNERGNKQPLVKPRAVRPGERIAIVAPASPFVRETFELGVREVKALGFEPVYDESVFNRRGYLAGDAVARARALEAAWQDSSVAAILVARGGYGSVQVLPMLDPTLARSSRKPLVGYSDITSLLSFLVLHCGVACFYGPSVAGCLARADAGYERRSLLAALTRCEPLGNVQADGLEALKSGEAHGPLYGGTLTQLVSSLGTPFAFDPPQGFVLLIDEVGERPYKLDRMLTQLSQAGILERASAVVFNELPKCDEPGGQPTARDTVADVLREFPGPVLFGLRTGHTTSPALTVPLGVRVGVIASTAPAFVVEEAAVEP